MRYDSDGPHSNAVFVDSDSANLENFFLYALHFTLYTPNIPKNCDKDPRPFQNNESKLPDNDRGIKEEGAARKIEMEVSERIFLQAARLKGKIPREDQEGSKG